MTPRTDANGITALRLGLAALVALSHTFQVGAFGPDPLERLGGPDAKLGTLAVLAFFGLSGYLLVDSRVRSRRISFVGRRLFRIFPGLWACLLVTAFVIAPLAAVLTGVSFDPWSAAAYVGGNAFLLDQATGIQHLYMENPLIGGVNVSLWTLGPELLCYLALAVAPVRLLRPAIFGVLVAAVVVEVADLTLVPTMLGYGLPVSFAVGALIGSGGLRPSLRSAAGALAITLVAAAAGQFQLIGPWCIPIAAIGIGLRLPFRWKSDLSYGTYLYAFPVQQTLQAAALPLGLLPGFAISMGLTLGLAWLSWVIVEAPGIALGRRSWGRLHHPWRFTMLPSPPLRAAAEEISAPP